MTAKQWSGLHADEIEKKMQEITLGGWIGEFFGEIVKRISRCRCVDRKKKKKSDDEIM